jgi:copper chaperone CopZ
MEFTVTNMTCNHCKMTIEKALKDSGVSEFEINLENKQVYVTSDELSFEAIQEVIASKGYEVK